MKRSLAVAIALASAIPATALAHKAWLQPSQTVIAGTNPWITVDAAVSNDLFYFEHVPMRLDDLVITAPDGSTVKPENASTGKYRSEADLAGSARGVSSHTACCSDGPDCHCVPVQTPSNAAARHTMTRSRQRFMHAPWEISLISGRCQRR